MQQDNSRRRGGTKYAAERWAAAVAPVTTASADLRTLAAWSRFIGVSGGAVRLWCRAAGERPKASLDLARLVRAIRSASSGRWDLLNVLDVVDDRTLRRLFSRCGISMPTTPPDIDDFLQAQRLVTVTANLDALRALVHGDPRTV